MKSKPNMQHSRAINRKSHFYEVFARKTSDDPLTHIGSVKAPNDRLAQARAWFAYDEHIWREMCIVPSSAVIPITERNSNVKIKVV